MARGKIWWPNIDADIESCARNCSRCAEIANSPAEAPLHSWDLPSGPWQRVHLDFAGPFYGSMWLIYIDAYSKYAGSVPMRSTTGLDLVGIMRQIFSTFGLVEQLVTDNGPQFVSEEFRKFCATNAINTSDQRLTGRKQTAKRNASCKRSSRAFGPRMDRRCRSTRRCNDFSSTIGRRNTQPPALRSSRTHVR